MFRRLSPLMWLAVASVPVSVALASGGGSSRLLHHTTTALDSVALDEDQEASLEALKADLGDQTRRGDRGRRGEHARRDKRGEPGECKDGRGGPRDADHEARHEERRERGKLIRAQLASPTPDAEALHALIDASPRGAASAEDHAKLDRFLALHATLSDEQRESLVQAMAEYRGRGRRGHGPDYSGSGPTK